MTSSLDSLESEVGLLRICIDSNPVDREEVLINDRKRC